ncbi:MAG: TipAS antibiotic-recognition domain-containing protein [Anaeroplasmataceae bacterium]
MGTQALNDSKFKEYEKKAKDLWGDTDAYKESEKKLKNRTDKENSEIHQGMMNLFVEFGNLLKNNIKTNSNETNEQVIKLQNYITSNYYNCTDEILLGLSDIYKEDEEFTNNIDKAGGIGTALYTSNSIKEFFSKK